MVDDVKSVDLASLDTVGNAPTAIGSGAYSGFMLSTGAATAPSGWGPIGVNERPARPPKKKFESLSAMERKF